MYHKAVIELGTMFEAEGMTEPKALFAVRELRWWVSSGQGERRTSSRGRSFVPVFQAATGN